MIRRRHVYHVAGYDPVNPVWQRRRFAKGLRIFADVWGVRTEMPGDEDLGASAWKIVTYGPNWRTEADFELMRWDDIVAADLEQPLPARIARSLPVLAEFVGNGTFLRYCRTFWGYGVFFLMPWLLLAAAIGIAAGIGNAAASFLFDKGAAAAALAAALAVAVFVLLLRWPGRYFRVGQALADWIFARDFLRGKRPDLEARIDAFADTLVAKARSGDVDEIVIVGHSLGATLAAGLLARALERDPALGRRGPAICLATVGATIPKFTLHRGAEHLREQVRRVAAEPSVAWSEFHSRADLISFYKIDPVSLASIDDPRPNDKPLVRLVQLHEMMSRMSYYYHRFHPMRLHYQCVMANQKRARYDYFMMICGPIPFARWTAAALGPCDFIMPDGSFVEPSILSGKVAVCDAGAGARGAAQAASAR
jgi:pimeloyl-ACP methyl ester carboxylesterase